MLDFLVIKYEELTGSKSISLGRKRLLMAEKVPHVRLNTKVLVNTIDTTRKMIMRGLLSIYITM